MSFIVDILQTLNSLTPLAVIALLGLVIFLLVKHREAKDSIDNITHNHLHELPAILETLQRIEVTLSKEFTYIKAKLNGGP